jgi:eukaryotic-like serine/threonine-protein kinase
MATMVKAGRYEILGELGRGAMGVVYRAMDPVIGRTVAVKTIRLSEEGTGLTRPELLSRFQTEARAAGLLTHPNIVVVYDAGEENGLFYITMELVEGKSLQSLLDGGHAFPVPRVLRILEQTCSALQFAHERNVVHRDIKPANLMLTADDTVKVTDFGTAKILQFGTAQQTTHVMGTPSYMSPEQVKGRPVDGRSDIFSLGVVFYEMLTGEKPFPGQSITTVIYKIVNEDPIPPRQLNPSIHPGLNEIVMRTLAKEPEVRYQSCREVLEDVRNYRAMGGNDRSPDATLISPRLSAAMPMGATSSAFRGPHAEDPLTAATVRSLQNRAGAPSQTPVIRRTASLPPYQEPPRKKSPVATVFAAFLLIGVIVYGGYKLRPEFRAAQERNQSLKTQFKTSALPVQKPAAPRADAPMKKQAVAVEAPAPESTSSDPAPEPNPKVAPTSPESTPDSKPKGGPGPRPELTPESNAKAAPTTLLETVEKKPEASLAPLVETKKQTLGITTAAAEYKGRIEEALAERKLRGRVNVGGTGNTITLSGKLRPAEHAALLKFMRDAPGNVRVVDDIQYDDSPLAGSNQADNDAHPVPSDGNGAIHLLTDVLGATATLYGPSGQLVTSCQTPCSFNDLAPARYSLQVKKEGYLQVQTALEVRVGESLDQKIRLESLTKGLFVSSRPAGADIFINGAKQSGQTPATLPLAPGQYDLVLRLQGYDAYAGHVQVKDNIQTTLDVELKDKAQQGHVAWAQVSTTPNGAEIFIDGNSTGQFAPARIQVPIGSHMIAMKLDGFKVARREVEVSEGGTVLVTETLTPK